MPYNEFTQTFFDDIPSGEESIIETSRRGELPSGELPVSHFKPNVPLEKRWDRVAHMPQCHIYSYAICHI